MEVPIKRKQGQVIKSKEREMVLRVYNYLAQKNPAQSVSWYTRECSEATGVSVSAIYKLRSEASRGCVVSPKKRRMQAGARKNSRKVRYNDFVRSGIRRIAHDFFFQNHPPTLGTVLRAVNDDPDLPNFKRTTMYRLLVEMGFGKSWSTGLAEGDDSEDEMEGVMELSSNIVTHSGSHQVYIKQEPWCPNETSTALKCGEFMGNTSQGEMIPDNATQSKNNIVYSNDRETNVKIEIKTEAPWIETSSTEMGYKSEIPSDLEVTLHRKIKETDEITEETSRLSTEAMCRNGDSTLTNIKLENDPEASQILHPTQDSGVTDCNSTPDYKTPHQCENCGKCFKVYSRLKRHLPSHESKKAFKCEICGKNSSDASTLIKHKLTHEGIRPYPCEICNKSFFTTAHLREHHLIHIGKKPHVCEICNSSFILISNLNKHKLIHNGTKAHTCDICSRSFTHGHSLRKHKLIHENKRAHVCETCGKKFTLVAGLKRHALTHGDKRPHACDICDKTFTLAQTLKQHKLTHPCHVCSEPFANFSDLNKHKLAHKDQGFSYRSRDCEMHE